jgi:hypothetical protein
VGVRVSRSGKPALAYTALMGYGRRSVLWRVPKRAGTYDVTITAVDLAGNSNEITGSVQVLKPRRKHT